MRRTFSLLPILLLAASLPLAAQSAPKADVFAGYSFASADFGIERETTNGLGFSVHGAFNDKFGVEGDFSAGWGSFLGISFNVQTYMGGVRLTQRGEKASGFFHFLAGGARASALGFSETDTALGIGGGVDLQINDAVSYRVVQADYIPVFGDGETAHNFRVQSGIVFTFGR